MTRDSQRGVTINDIARLSGVSNATVSRVLNGHGGASTETQARIRQAAKTANYRANDIARTLRESKSRNIGLLVPDVTNPFFASVAQSLEQKLFSEHYSTIICNTNRDVEKERAYLRRLSSKMIDGLILISGGTDVLHKDDLPNLPIICIDRELTATSTAFVSSAHYDGARMAAELLYARDTAPIVLTHTYPSSTSEARIRGFTETINRESRGQVNPVSFAVDGDTGAEQTAAIVEFLKHEYVRHDQPLGIFAVNDNLAVEVVRAAAILGLGIPDRVRVIGFDDAPITSLIEPQITTIHQDVTTLAEHTCKRLLELIGRGEKSPALPASHDIVPVRLIERATT